MVYSQPLSPESPERQERSRTKRVRVLIVGFVALFLAVAYYLVRLQVIESEAYRKLADGQYKTRKELPAIRGSICDRNGTVIASNTLLWTYVADPKCAGDSACDALATVFARAFGGTKEAFRKKMKPKSHYSYLARLVDPETLRCEIPEKMKGLIVLKEPTRLYYHKTVAGQLVGTTDVDNRGIMGLELSLNKKLEGKDGYIVKQRDGLGRETAEIEYPRSNPVNGHSIYLTIDLRLQFIAEEELKAGVEKNKAESGIALMMNPKTGEILAFAQYPPVDPAQPSSSEQKDQKLKLVTDRIEPGSVFKIVTASAAIENHVVTPDQLFSAESGKWAVPIGRGRVRRIIDDHPHGIISVQRAMAVSSNIVMAKISNLVGPELFYKMARAYGFGNLTNVELPGEVRGRLSKPSDWSGTTLNTMAFGYEVGVTPLQLLCAYGVVANGGYLMKPYIVDREVDAQGNTVSKNNPQTIRKVISPETVEIMTRMFEEVVDSGTATSAQITGLRIAGKTGTAKRNIKGHYEKGKYTASFIGFYPVEDPKIVCLVMMDNPKGASIYGGLTSAPVFRSIALRAINTTDALGILRLNTGDSTSLPIPIPLPDGNIAGRISSREQDSMIIQPMETLSPEDRIVPNVKGMSVRQALSLLTEGQFAPVVEGSGVVVNQEPPAGTIVRPGSRILLTCETKTITVQSRGGQ